MAKITRDLHDRCNAKFREIKARDPEAAQAALARGIPMTPGTPVHDLMLDLTSLSEVASGFATGASVRAAVLKRAMSALAA